MAPERSLVAAEDLWRLGAMLSVSAVATLWPQRGDRFAIKVMERFTRRQVAVAAHMAAALPGRPADFYERAAQEYAQMQLEDAWGRMREIGPRRWQPDLILEGDAPLREALGHRGAVVWGMRFAATIALQQAFQRAGLPLVHVSSSVHGARSHTRFAESINSPLFARGENRYLAARVIIPRDGSLAYLKAVREHLRRRAVVSLFGEHLARGSVTVPFLGTTRAFASGPPSLAWQEDAALFTAHALRVAPFTYRVVIGEPIPVDRSVPRKQFAANAIALFAQRLQRIIEKSPENWQGWAEWPPGIA